MLRKLQNQGFWLSDRPPISGVVPLRKDTLFERHHVEIDRGDAKEHLIPRNLCLLGGDAKLKNPGFILGTNMESVFICSY